MPTILVVDDLAANRTLLVTLLRHHGHRVIEAPDGSQGLSAVRAERPDLVITDVLMPVMDGYEFVRQLRKDPATSRLPVAFYTAHYGEREARELALSIGVSDVLPKPASSAEVLEIVERLLSTAPASKTAPVAAARTGEFDRNHLRLVTDKLSEKATDLKSANERLRALINVGLELASERNSDRQLHTVCAAALDLFGASYVSLGILDLDQRTVQTVANCGSGRTEWIAAGDSIPGILETVVNGRRPLRGQNTTGDPSTLGLPPRHPPVSAFLAAPIASPSQVYGWLCLVGDGPRAFTKDDEDLVMALAGQVGRIHELEREIHVRKRAEAALRETAERAQRYLDTATVMLLALDPAGCITLVNRFACGVLGWSEKELIGQNWFTYLAPRMRETAKGRFQELLNGRTSVSENTILTRSGVERVIEWRSTVVRDDDGSVVGTMSSGTDVTERNAAVLALRTAEERMRFALQSANVGVWDIDYATGAVRWSEILEAQHGMLPGTFDGNSDTFWDTIHPQDRAALVETLAEGRRTGNDFSVLHRTVWRDGSVRWLSGAGRFVLGPDGKPARGIGVSLDVTDRHRLEEQFHQSRKMEAIGRLAGGVAHDFNNLLTAILGYCELLLADGDAGDPRQQDVAEIQKAGLSAAQLTRHLLAFSRKEIIEPTLLDLDTVVTGMRGMLSRLIPEDVEVVLQLRAGTEVVLADRGQLEQIVMNLAVNARDAMPKGGTLTIATSSVMLDHQSAKTHLGVNPGPYVALTVADTGVGMSAEARSRLFEPFFTTKEPGKGTGLGLATVHAIVTQSGGSVDVSSEAEGGSTFTVYLPRADVTPTAPGAPSLARPIRSAGGTVLVVEDSASVRELARRLLERHGYTVLVAANAEQATQIFERNESIDLLLTDVVMPGGSGPELTARLIARRPGLKVLYMSGYTDDAIAQHGVLNPGIAFLHKPFTADLLDLKIREVIDGGARSDAPTA
jgi:two-component system, cell cycle sensor histidine kinase and response regulator CckA